MTMNWWKLKKRAVVKTDFVNSDQKNPECAEPDNSYFGASLRWKSCAEKYGNPMWKRGGPCWNPEIRETREQLIAAKLEVLEAREKVIQLKKKMHAQFQAIQEKRKSEKNHCLERSDNHRFARWNHCSEGGEKNYCSEGGEKNHCSEGGEKNHYFEGGMKNHCFARWNHCSEGGKKNFKVLARLVKQVNVPNCNEFSPNSEFVCILRFRNESNRSWPEAQLIFVGKSTEDRLTDVSSLNVGTLAAGEEKDISIKMKAPLNSGRYVSAWKLYDPESKLKFGQKIKVQIHVSGGDSGDENDKKLSVAYLSS